MMIKDRFLSHVNTSENPNSCWEWVGSKTPLGYGQLKINSKLYRAHRVSFELFVGPIPENLFVCHSCDNRACVNPSHLFLGTHQDNMTDKVSKNRQSHSTKMRGEANGNKKLTKESIFQIRELLRQNYTLQEIANKFGVGRTAIYKIKSNENWGWLKS